MSDPLLHDAQEANDGRGILKIFLGYAPGVGKTYAMLDEAHRRRRRGQSVVVAFVDHRDRKDTLEELDGLEIIAPKSGAIDVEAVIARKPGVVLIDDLEKTNPSGSPRAKRWQDVDVILEAGISVLTNVSVYHLESLNDLIRDITGQTIEETVPDQVLHRADEIELVDLTPRALINRLRRGDVFALDTLTDAQREFFKEGNLVALRELAMREAAGVVDEDLTEYRRLKNIEKPWATKDRVMICVAPNRNSLRLIRKGWRMGQRLRGEVIVVHVEESGLNEHEQKMLRDDFSLATRLGIKTTTLKGSVAAEIIRFASENNVTQILLGHPERSRFQEMVRPSLVSELARSLRTIDITLVAAEKTSA